MKDQIVERLLDQGHIVIACADRLLNHKGAYLQDIEDLHRDGNIGTKESIILLKEDSSFNTPNYPIMDQPNIDWPLGPNRTGAPKWEVTCSNDLNNTI